MTWFSTLPIIGNCRLGNRQGHHSLESWEGVKSIPRSTTYHESSLPGVLGGGEIQVVPRSTTYHESSLPGESWEGWNPYPGAPPTMSHHSLESPGRGEIHTQEHHLPWDCSWRYGDPSPRSFCLRIIYNGSTLQAPPSRLLCHTGWGVPIITQILHTYPFTDFRPETGYTFLPLSGAGNQKSIPWYFQKISNW